MSSHTQIQQPARPPIPQNDPKVENKNGFSQWLDKMQNKIQKFENKQPTPIKATIRGALGGGQGLLIGVLFEQFMSPQMQQMQNGQPNMPPVDPSKMKYGLAALIGSQAASKELFKRYWKKEEDLSTNAASAFVGGSAYALATNNSAQWIGQGMAFALISAVFYQIGQAFGGGDNNTGDLEYERVKFMMGSLGYQKHFKKLQKQELNDRTIMLWDDSCLRDAQIPAGPRRVIIHHVQQLQMGRGQVIPKPAPLVPGPAPPVLPPQQ